MVFQLADLRACVNWVCVNWVMKQAEWNPHEVLGISPDADVGTIKRTYLRLARTAHPDAGGSPEAFTRLNAAYQALIHPDFHARTSGPAQREEPGPGDAAFSEELRQELEARLARAAPAGQIDIKSNPCGAYVWRSSRHLFAARGWGVAFVMMGAIRRGMSGPSLSSWPWESCCISAACWRCWAHPCAPTGGP